MSVKHPPPYTSKEVGVLGEQVAAEYLVARGYEVLDKNYAKKYGEVDIVARETGNSGPRGTEIVHFVEVKTVSHETKEELEHAVTHETWRPEELVHAFKLNQIRKVAETWVHEKQWQGNVQIDVAAVRMVPQKTFATVNYIENILI